MFSPKLYTIRKFKFKDIIKSEYKLNLTLEQESYYYIQQQDNMLFRQIRLITSNLDDYNPYIIFVDCKSCKTWTDKLTKLIKDGFIVNGRNFILTEKSASMSRNAILGFVDSEIEIKLNKAITMDLNFKKTVISKYFGYRGLMFSSCFCLENWYPKIIVVKDYEKIISNQHIKYLVDKETEYTDKNTGELKIWKEKDIIEGYKDIKINIADGSGLHHPNITQEIKIRIGIKEEPTSVMWRLPFCKGITHDFNYTEFFESMGIYEITDIWNEKHSIYEPMIIFTESMYKGFKYFKKFGDIRDWNIYWEKFKKYNHCIGIAKWNYSFKEEPLYKTINYQILQDLYLDFEDFIQLANDSTEWVDKIINGDLIYTYCFLGLSADKINPSNDYMKAILKNPEMLKEECVRKYFIDLLKKYINEFKCGKLWLESSHRILTPDLIMLAEHIGGITPVGCLKGGEFYSKNINGVCEGEFLIERNPHIASSEHVILNGVDNKLLQKYCGHLANIIMFNGYDVITSRLNGGDTDGDLCLVLKNSIMQKGVNFNKPFVIDIEDKATIDDQELSQDNIINNIILSMDNRIGEYSNVASSYHNKCPRSQEQRDKYEKYIDLVSILNAKEIDYAKCGVRFNLPRFIAKYAKPLPYFMKYAGSYYKNMKSLSKSKSNMNRLCFEIEKWSKQIRFQRKYTDFDYTIMQDNSIEWDELEYQKLKELYFEFSKEIGELQKENSIFDKKNLDDNYQNYFGDLNTEEITNTKINWNYYYQDYKVRANKICSNQKKLANYAVEIVYSDFPKKSKKFMWVVASQGILQNLKQVNIQLPIEDVNGQYLYLGKKYNLKETDLFAK